MVVYRNARFWKILMSGCALTFFAGGRRDLMRKLDMMVRVRHRKPNERMAHAQPILSKRLCNMSGKSTPPREPAVEATPVANPRRRRKKCPTAAIDGVNRSDDARPLMTPNDKRKCQYARSISG